MPAALSTDQLSMASGSGMSALSLTDAGSTMSARPATFELQTRPTKDYLVRKLHDFASVQHRLHDDIGGTKHILRGVLGVRILAVNVHRHDDFLRSSDHVLVQVNTSGHSRRTWPVENNHGRATFHGQTLHLPLNVPRTRSHPFNQVEFQVLGVPQMVASRSGGGSGWDSGAEAADAMLDAPGPANELGTLTLHLHDIIQCRCIGLAFDLWDVYSVVGQLEMELTFNYGTFGYGCSPQLVDPTINVREALALSLFPRVDDAMDEHNDSENIVPGDQVEDDEFRQRYVGTRSRVGRLLMLRHHVATSTDRQQNLVTVSAPKEANCAPGVSAATYLSMYGRSGSDVVDGTTASASIKGLRSDASLTTEFNVRHVRAATMVADTTRKGLQAIKTRVRSLSTAASNRIVPIVTADATTAPDSIDNQPRDTPSALLPQPDMTTMHNSVPRPVAATRRNSVMALLHRHQHNNMLPTRSAALLPADPEQEELRLVARQLARSNPPQP